MLSENLEQSLHKAMTCAADRGAELVTLEHLLYALIDDNDASELLSACSIDLKRLKSELEDFMTDTLDKQKIKLYQIYFFKNTPSSPSISRSLSSMDSFRRVGT